MKSILLLLLLAGILPGASIDTKLFEGTEREAYYGQVLQQIDAAEVQGTISKALADEERMELDRLRRASAPSAPIERDGAAFLPQTPPNTTQAYYALQTAASMRLKAADAQQRLRDIQAKLAFLKRAVEDITAAEKPHLLSYQLQFAYYKVQQKNFEAKVRQLEQYADDVMSALQNRLPALQCANAVSAAEAEAEAQKGLQQKVAAEIALERAQLEGGAGVDKLITARNAAETHYDALQERLLKVQSQIALCLLREKADKRFFRLLEQMENSASHLPKEQMAQYKAQNDVLRHLAKALFGVTALVLGDTLHETRTLLSKAGETLSAPLFVFNEHAVSLLSLFKAALILVLGIIAGMVYKRWIVRLARRWPDMSQMSLRLASNIGYYLIIFLALIFSVGSLGIDMTSISLIAGALSIGVGFGLQTVVSNFIAGIILMFERTIRIGDTIEISDVLRGRVTDMRIRSTTVKTFDNIDIVVPNSSFIQSNVINWTLEDATRRIHIPFGVAYGTDVDAVKTAVLGELNNSSLNYIKYDPEKQPEVWMVAMNNSSVDFELLVWVEWASKLKPNALRSDFLILIYNALYKHGIEIPFPQLDLYVKQMPKPDPS